MIYSAFDSHGNWLFDFHCRFRDLDKALAEAELIEDQTARVKLISETDDPQELPF